MPITAYHVQSQIGRAIQEEQPRSDELGALAMDVSTDLSEGESEDLSFLGAIPALREWKGKREGAQPVEYDWSLKNKKFEGSIFIPDKWMKNDKTGLIQRRKMQLATRERQWRSALIADLILNMASGAAFDGKYFVASDHAWGASGTIDNDLTYNGSATPTAYEVALAILQAWTAMLGFKDDQGELCNEGITDLALVCGTTLGGPLVQALDGKVLDTGSGAVDSPISGLKAAVRIRPIVSARVETLGSGLGMLMVNATPGAAPFVFQRNAASFRVDALDETFSRDGWSFGVKEVGNAGYGLFTDVCYTLFN